MNLHGTTCKVRRSKSSRCQRTGRLSSKRSKPSNRSSVRNRTTTVAIRSSTSNCAVSHGRPIRSPFATRSLRLRRVWALSSAYRRITEFRSLPTSHDVNILSTDNVLPLIIDRLFRACAPLHLDRNSAIRHVLQLFVNYLDAEVRSRDKRKPSAGCGLFQRNGEVVSSTDPLSSL